MGDIVTAAQMKEHERYVMESVGMDAVLLMERAALFAAETIDQMIGKMRSKVMIVCGPGNNGADGLALARILEERGCCSDVLLLGEKEKQTSLRQKQEEMFLVILGEEAEHRVFRSLTDTKERQTEYSVIVDAILGIGANRELCGEIKETVEWMNRCKSRKLALDVPTGICSDTGRILGTAFRADVTATFGCIKQGLLLGDGAVYAGKVCLNSCGMFYPYMKKVTGKEEKAQTFFLDKKIVKSYLTRDPQGNKSTFGKIGFIAGSSQIAGAAILNVCAAFRCGGGYVRLCTHKNNREALLDAAPETVLDLYDDVIDEAIEEKVERLITFANVICAGSGLGMSKMAKNWLKVLLLKLEKQSEKILILDADALNLIAEDTELMHRLDGVEASVVLTPHVLEFSRLCKRTVEQIKNDRVQIAREFAAEHGVTLVLKDAQTIVADKLGNVCINVTGNDGMAVAGSGDVLAGVITGICGQIKQPYISACLGVYIHGMAGDMAARKLGTHSMLPTDMIRGLKKCMKKLGKEAI